MSVLMRRVKRGLGWRLYFWFARFLPRSFAKGGRFGKWARALCCRQFLEFVGEGANIQRGVDFSAFAKVRVGKRSWIGVNCNVWGSVTIEDEVLMGPDCEIHSFNHGFSRFDIPIMDQDFTEDRPVHICKGAWIGSSVILLPGVRIGEGAVIGAGSVVTKDIPDYAVAVGNPAIVKKYRK